jgi:hypothetical protein
LLPLHWSWLARLSLRSKLWKLWSAKRRLHERRYWRSQVIRYEQKSLFTQELRQPYFGSYLPLPITIIPLWESLPLISWTDNRFHITVLISED